MNTEKIKQSTENTNSLCNPIEALRTHGIYPTSQRKIIANMLLIKHQHLTAEQIYSAIHSKDSKVSQATVYNTLGLFVKKGLLREVFVESSKTFYDTNTQSHQHFYNVDTGELIDIQKHLEPCFTQHELPPATQIDSVDTIVRIKNYSA